MAFRLGNDASNNPRLKSNDAFVDCVDVGTTNTAARILIYPGTQPTTPQTSTAETALVTIPFANPAFTASDANGSAGLSGGLAISATVTVAGTAAWFRVTDRNNVAIFDGSISTSGADMNFANTSFVVGGTAKINTMTISTPM